MSTATTPATITLAPRHPARGLLAQVTRTELRLFLREPVGLLWGLLFPVVLLVVLGSIPGTRKHSDDLDGQSVVEAYVPILTAFTFAMLALNAMPPALAGYREKGVLRRLSTTPLPPSRVLGAQILIHGAVATLATAVITLVARFAFGVHLPRAPFAFVVTVVLTGLALFAIGLFVSAVAANTKVANGAGAVLFFVSMFFAGLWLPRAKMPDTLRTIGDCTPLGAGVRALGDAGAGHWPHGSALPVLAGYALVFGIASARWFRWE
ncbi:ABC transporter permease [Embleya sp. NPDC059237]|uniref:ABC transporter permease n=1 Tax=Embleya sp. NPDC059237 TaxID=3346784 RepID=UPI0036891906